ncbi:MAG: hypothetical protein WC223_13105 [Bacteroidales bacterium]|jgi:hypothetical protein
MNDPIKAFEEKFKNSDNYYLKFCKGSIEQFITDILAEQRRELVEKIERIDKSNSLIKSKEYPEYSEGWDIGFYYAMSKVLEILEK